MLYLVLKFLKFTIFYFGWQKQSKWPKQPQLLPDTDETGAVCVFGAVVILGDPSSLFIYLLTVSS